MQCSCIHDVVNALTSKVIYDRWVKYPTGREPPNAKVADDPLNRYRHFHGAVGSIDGTHIAVKVSPRMQPAYRNRKGVVSINVLAACDFDLKFTYIIAGWEGSANDSFTFNQAVHSYNFPQLPSNRYFLADAGFPICDQLLTPYRGTRYHLADFHPSRGA